MRAGKLRHRIIIQQKAPALDEYGGTVYEWSDYATVWAKKRPLRGRELMAAQAAQSETTVMFYTRYLSGINSTMRIVHDGEYYDIASVIDVDERHRELEISAKTGMSEG